jgi:FtsH-binding integral membrane protein
LSASTIFGRKCGRSREKSADFQPPCYDEETMQDDKARRNSEREREHARRMWRGIRLLASGSLTIAVVGLYAVFAYHTFAYLGLQFLPRGVPALVAAALAILLAMSSLTSGSKPHAYRAGSAALFAGCFAILYATDPSWNVQNVLMGIGVLISIAAVVVPPLRRNAPGTDSPEVTHHAGHA